MTGVTLNFAPPASDVNTADRDNYLRVNPAFLPSTRAGELWTSHYKDEFSSFYVSSSLGFHSDEDNDSYIQPRTLLSVKVCVLVEAT